MRRRKAQRFLSFECLVAVLLGGLLRAEPDGNNTCSTAQVLDDFGGTYMETLNASNDSTDYWQFTTTGVGSLSVWVSTQTAYPCVINWTLYVVGGGCNSALRSGTCPSGGQDLELDIPATAGTYKLWLQHGDSTTGDRRYLLEVDFEEGNTCPVLSDSLAELDESGASCPDWVYNFYVHYYDADGDAPSTRYVYVTDSMNGERRFTMQLDSGTAADGTYVYTMAQHANAGPLPEPFDSCGVDVTRDTLECEEFAPCK